MRENIPWQFGVSAGSDAGATTVWLGTLASSCDISAMEAAQKIEMIAHDFFSFAWRMTESQTEFSYRVKGYRRGEFAETLIKAKRNPYDGTAVIEYTRTSYGKS